MRSGQRAGVFVGGVRVLLSGVLCVLMVEQPMVAAAATKRAVEPSVKQIESDQRALHALNRFTFGPRPGDVAAVREIGVKAWFERQLNPQSIDDSALEVRLAAFPAMQMEQTELMQRYPSPAVLRQMIAKNEPLPSDPVEHAIYADQIAFYKTAKAKKEAEQAAAAKNSGGEDGVPAAGGMASDGSMAKSAEEMKGTAALPGDGVDPATPAMATHEEQFYSGLDAVRVINLPPDERMQRILAMPPEELVRFRKSLSNSEMAAAADGLSPMQRETLASLQGSPRIIGAELLESRMLRDIYSERQLEAVMTDFWLNHFNVYIKKNQNEPFLLPAYERDVIRPRALGKFEDLLVATAKSPAMLMYLDNWQSIGPDSLAARNGGKLAKFAQNPQVKQALKDRGLNENYARELMELHTLGVQCEVSADRPVSMLDKACGRGYTQQDVTEVAEVLTGWTIDQPARSGTYRFEERRHEPGTKTVLGKKIGEKGEAEGLEVLHLLATSPATARFVSRKLAVRFVSDTPPPALVDRMAKAFVVSGGDIKTVLRTMFDSPEFWSPEVRRAKVKTPEEFVASAVRASGAEVTTAIPLYQALEKLGMPLYGMQTPNGYSWMAEPWVNSGDLVNRLNFAVSLSNDRVGGVQTDWARMLGEASAQGLVATGDSAAEKEKKLEVALLGQAVSDRTRETVLAQFQDQTTQQQAEKSFGIRANEQEPMAQVLNISSPKQKVRPPLDREAAGMAGLLLGSPEFQRR
ncbi:DUF1800 domain-containing protein [Tunturiibacter empetritectus]|uniref:Uncharacterized protein (DUF1800 family) n=1 Tax=Tunturiibacter lichenicola TaxID=2051959 RepID=A0A852VF58_9BACT|nr:DUF1800 domain-containing protein [Edaphobacter lichenicola]NYF89569.1 uncharacterized protein (DUF1800 family) [Edaphobacter lichenicola]